MKINTLLPLLLVTVLITISLNGQIIADHSIVDDYEIIPQQYIDSVKKMWVTVPGESHSSGYRIGLALLEQQDSTFQVNIQESGTPEGDTNIYLRFSRASWGDLGHSTGWRYSYGEEDWFTSQTARDRTAAGIYYCHTNGFKLNATGFGWCWDMTWQNAPGGDTNTVYQVRWAGSSEGGPQGSNRWGLTAEDSALTGNSVCMDTYINATMDYIQLCKEYNFPTKVFFTTGPVDGGGNTGERGYQRYIKHEYIRNHVRNTDSLILFDYADILCWGSDGAQNTTTWTDHGGTLQTFPFIHSDNMLDLNGSYEEDGDHIGERGAIRLAKAMWWMLARMAGWEGSTNLPSQVANDLQIMLYPNPSSGEFTIEVKSGDWVNMNIVSLNGQIVYAKRYDQNVGVDDKIDLTEFPAGVYFVSLISNATITTKKLIIIR